MCVCVCVVVVRLSADEFLKHFNSDGTATLSNRTSRILLKVVTFSCVTVLSTVT